MAWLNEYEVNDLQRRFDPNVTPNAAEGAAILGRLVRWTNQNSDGWPYWIKPAKAAGKLMDLLSGVTTPGGYRVHRNSGWADITESELTAASKPIKAFLTRQGVDHSAVFTILVPAGSVDSPTAHTFEVDQKFSCTYVVEAPTREEAWELLLLGHGEPTGDQYPGEILTDFDSVK